MVAREALACSGSDPPDTALIYAPHSALSQARMEAWMSSLDAGARPSDDGGPHNRGAAGEKMVCGVSCSSASLIRSTSFPLTHFPTRLHSLFPQALARRAGAAAASLPSGSMPSIVGLRRRRQRNQRKNRTPPALPSPPRRAAPATATRPPSVAPLRGRSGRLLRAHSGGLLSRGLSQGRSGAGPGAPRRGCRRRFG